MSHTPTRRVSRTGILLAAALLVAVPVSHAVAQDDVVEDDAENEVVEDEPTADSTSDDVVSESAQRNETDDDMSADDEADEADEADGADDDDADDDDFDDDDFDDDEGFDHGDLLNDESQDEESFGDHVSVEGSARFGWRLLSGRGRGRFLQDIDLGAGARLFDLDLRVLDDREDATFDELSVSARDVGERSSDATLALRRGSELLIEGKYFRELFTYRADGDPFPRDSTRERYNTRLRYAPHRGITFRLGWDRSERRGESIASQNTDFRDDPPPPGVDSTIVTTKRPFDETFDTLTAGVDGVSGPWRVGLTTSFRRGRISDKRRFDVPPSQRGADPINESFTRRTDSRATTVIGKLGRSFLDDAIESTLFLTYTRQPVDSSLGGSGAGFDNAVDGSGTLGAFSSTSDGDTDLDRSIRTWELETSWQITDALEAILLVGQEEFVDDASLRLIETRNYDRSDLARRTTRTSRDGRTTNRVDRAQIDLLYELTDKIDLRGGYERFSQDIKAPFETRGASLDGAKLDSVVERWNAGFDVKPVPRLKISVLARRSRDDDTPAAPSAERADDVTARVRWGATDTLSFAGMYRYRGFHQSSEFDSSTKSEIAALTATWSQGPWTVDGSLTRLTLDTATDTSFFVLDAIGFRKINDDVTYKTRDLIVSLNSTYMFNARTRASAGGHALRSRGAEGIDSHEFFVTLAHDLNERVTTGLTVRSWRFDEIDTSADDYDADALEIWLEYRF